MYIICNKLITAKNLQNPRKLKDTDLVKSYITRLHKENATFVYSANNTLTVRQYLSCYMSANGEVYPEFTYNPQYALNIPTDIADQLLAHKCIIGGNMGWHVVEKLPAANVDVLNGEIQSRTKAKNQSKTKQVMRNVKKQG